MSKREKERYDLVFYKENTKLRTATISEAQLSRQALHKIAVNTEINFYALTGPYDCADEILRQWNKHFKKRSWLERIFGK
jgi:hypothetical protein